MKLDASATTLTDKTDEIVYFDRDYGDGEKIKDSSVGQTTHSYVYDESNNSGVYNPRVTIRTKK